MNRLRHFYEINSPILIIVYTTDFKGSEVSYELQPPHTDLFGQTFD